jgi:hypothetical protein
MKKIIFNRTFFFYSSKLIVLILFSIQIQTNTSNLTPVVLFANAQNQHNINSDCIIRGSLENPPPFLVLRWMLNGECDSTIDYFIPFYDVKAVVPFQNNFLLFLET